MSPEINIKMALPFKYSSSDYFMLPMTWDSYDVKNLGEFDKFIREKWDAIMADGYFRYALDHVKEKNLSGHQNLLLQLNQERAILRRTPQSFDSVSVPLDPNKFNFTKVKREEIVCELQPESLYENRNSEQERKHLLLVNVSPLAYGHCLVVPDVNDLLFQHMSPTAHELAIEMVLLSNHPGFRVGFNSLLALASVNHQHFHTWYLNQPLVIETAEAKQICPKFYEMVGMPTRAFLFQLEGSSVKEMARFGYIVTDYLVKNNVAHNVFVTRGQTICTTEKKCTVKLIIWPRKSIKGAKLDSDIPMFNVAVAELAGHVPVYDVDKFDTLTEEEVLRTIQDNLLSDEEFDEHKSNIASFIQR